MSLVTKTNLTKGITDQQGCKAVIFLKNWFKKFVELTFTAKHCCKCLLTLIEVNLKTVKSITALRCSWWVDALKSQSMYWLFLTIGCGYPSQACTLRRLLSWKAIISLLSQELIGKDTQWLGGLGNTLGEGGSLNFGPA